MATASVHLNVHGSEVYQGRWGFHPCSRATFLEFKEYHRYCLRDLRATKRRSRWDSKLPHNRVDKSGNAIPAPRCVGTDSRLYGWVLEEYRNLRHPKADPDSVVRFNPPRGWTTRLEELRAFYA